MAKKQNTVASEVTIKSWDDVNNNLKSLGELTVQKRTMENKKTELVADITAKFDADAAPVLKEMKRIENDIFNFVLSKKDEFVKSRTKELSHGTISMRVSTSVKILSKTVCVKALKSLNMGDYIKTTENPNKDMLSTLSDTELAKVACEKKTVDNVTILPKIQEINSIGGK